MHEDPAFEGALKDVGRRMFKTWVREDALTNPAKMKPPEDESSRDSIIASHARFMFCIHVDSACLASVPKDLPKDKCYEGSYANLVDASMDWPYPDFSTYDWSTYKAPPVDTEEYDEFQSTGQAWDGGEREVEGSKLYEVGWMKVKTADLNPDLYENLNEGYWWRYAYRRPLEFART